MAVVSKNLFTGTLTGSLAATYTAPAGTTGVVKAATFCNTTGSVVALTIQLIPRTGGTPAILKDARNLSASETYFGSELINQTLEAGGSILASGTGVEVSISGVEIV